MEKSRGLRFFGPRGAELCAGRREKLGGCDSNPGRGATTAGTLRNR